MTGKLSWDTTSINEGDYSLQIVTEDIRTGIRVAAEVVLRLVKNRFPAQPPNFPYLSDPLNLDIIYTLPGSTVDMSFEIDYDGDLFDMYSLQSISPVPRGFDTYVDVINNETGNTDF